MLLDKQLYVALTTNKGVPLDTFSPIDNLALPFGVDKVQGFLTEGNAFYIDLKTGEKFKAFELTEDLRRSEFESICKMIADKLFSA